MAPAAFQATFSAIRQINGRKVYQFVFEVPTEAADHALQVLGGVPDPGKSVWCGIARLEEPKEAKPPREKRRWEDMSAAQQAGVLCNERAFQKFLTEDLDEEVPDADTAASMIRLICGVQSRSHLDPAKPSGKMWEGIVGRYRVWQQAPAYVDA